MTQFVDGPLLSSPSVSFARHAASVLFISDVRLYCEALAFSLPAAASVSFAGHCGVGEALARLAETPVDVALIDTSAAEGRALARPIRARFPNISVLGLAVSGDAERVLECAEAGFSGCLPVETGIEKLAAMIAGAAHGELACSPHVAGRLFERLAALSAGEAQQLASPPAQDPGRKPMTRREGEIAELIRAGYTNKEIALKLHISPATVKNHVHNLLEKVAAPRRAAISAQIDACGVPWR